MKSVHDFSDVFSQASVGKDTPILPNVEKISSETEILVKKFF